MAINQNQYQALEFPVNDTDDQPVVSVDAASFFMFSRGVEILEIDLCTGGSFTDGIFTVPLNDTSEFDSSYYFEVWVIVAGKNYMTHSGRVEFNPTLGRVAVC